MRKSCLLLFRCNILLNLVAHVSLSIRFFRHALWCCILVYIYRRDPRFYFAHLECLQWTALLTSRVRPLRRQNGTLEIDNKTRYLINEAGLAIMHRWHIQNVIRLKSYLLLVLHYTVFHHIDRCKHETNISVSTHTLNKPTSLCK
jgi:hypothetical protein